MPVDPFLPGDLLPDIFNRVPLKTVLRCMCVCKSWYSIITSPRFVKERRRLSNIADEKQVFVWRQFDDGDKFYIHEDNDTFDRVSGFDSPFCFSATRIVSSSNGLICICLNQRKPRKQNVFLWNPTIRRFFQVPVRNSAWGTVGFGFVSATNEFKVVNVCNLGQRRTAVFELGTRSWKNLGKCKDFLSNYKIAADSPQSFLNDTIHWVGCELNGDSPLTILTFDMKNDEFGVLPVPSGVNDNRLSSHVRAIVYQDSLALVQIHEYFHYHNGCCIWVMNKYGVFDSWTKHFTILGLDFNDSNKLLGFNHNGDVLLARRCIKFRRGFRELFSHDPKSGRSKRLIGMTVQCDGTLINLIPPSNIVYADYLVQSLELLQEQRGLITLNRS